MMGESGSPSLILKTWEPLKIFLKRTSFYWQQGSSMFNIFRNHTFANYYFPSNFKETSQKALHKNHQLLEPPPPNKKKRKRKTPSLGISRNHTLLYQVAGDQLPHHQQRMLVVGYPWCEGPQQHCYRHHEELKQVLVGSRRSHSLVGLKWNITTRILILVL